MTDDLKERIAEAVAFRFEDSRTNRSLLIALHGEAFFTNLCPTCYNAQIQAYIELYRLINPKAMAIPTPPSKKYRFNPISEDAQVRITARNWNITADTLTDEQAETMLRMGGFTHLIVTVDEAEKIRAELKGESKKKKGGKAAQKEAAPSADKDEAELRALLDAKEIAHDSVTEIAELAALVDETYAD